MYPLPDSEKLLQKTPDERFFLQRILKTQQQKNKQLGFLNEQGIERDTPPKKINRWLINK